MSRLTKIGASAGIACGICGALGASALAAKPRQSAIAKTFRAELIEPGKTQASQLKELLGKPLQVVREGPTREYYFYGLGEGATMDATVHVRSGVVEYVTYLCHESMKEIGEKFSGETATNRTVQSAGAGYSGSLSQLVYEARGRGFVYEPKSKKVRACVAWEPGRKFDELGK